MKYIKLFENFDSHDPYELMMIPLNKKAEMIIEEIQSDKPNLNLVNDLIILGADLDWRYGDGLESTLLHVATNYGRVEVVRMLIDAGTNLNVQDNIGRTPLHWAAKNGIVKIARMLIDAGANVNVQDKDGQTPLHWAAMYGRVEIARMLIDAGAKKNIPDNKGKTPRDFAVWL